MPGSVRVFKSRPNVKDLGWEFDLHHGRNQSQQTGGSVAYEEQKGIRSLQILACASEGRRSGERRKLRHLQIDLFWRVGGLGQGHSM